MVFVVMNSFGQTASITKGCAPLTVQFEANNQSTYFWEFGDGDSSDKQNPEHAYVQPGSYVAKLYTSQGGQEVGAIDIKVYEDIVIEIITDTLGGCEPFSVAFSSNISKDPDIEIESYLWSFGDGNGSDAQNPINIYESEGRYDVSLEVATSIGECDKTIIVQDLITVEELYVFFRSDKNTSCSFPVNFFFENFSDEESNYTYQWDFGNGKTSNAFSPDSILYEEQGEYTISLTVYNGGVCTKTFERTIKIGSETLSQFTAPETACIGDTILLQADSNQGSFSWSISGGAHIDGVNDDQLTIIATEYGNVRVELTTTNSLGCSSTTYNDIMIEPNSSFSINPEGACAGSVGVELIADEKNYQNYIWNDSIEGGPVVTVNIASPDRDSFFINEKEYYTQSLRVETINGCTDSTTVEFENRPPEAYFIPNQVIGVAPFTVTFNDFSESVENITHRGWDYNDGNYIERPNSLTHNYTFTETGRYFVKLDIENEAECIDTSKGVWITVIDIDELLPPERPDAMCNLGTLPPPGDSLVMCLGTEVIISTDFIDDSPVQVHFETDDGRFDFCWNEGIGRHVMEHPGRFPILATLEFEGFILDTIEFGDFVVRGARSDFSYDYDCKDLTNIKLTEASLNANKWSWYHNGSLISTERKFTYDVRELGEHEIILEVENTDSGCPPHINSVEIDLKETKADFQVPDKICAFEPIKIDASNSQVSSKCDARYKWQFMNGEQRVSIRDSLIQDLQPGTQEITLILDEGNGCPDTLSKTIDVFGVIVDFNSDTLTCLPAVLNFESITESIAPITDYDWSFGSSEENTSHEFTHSDLASDSLFVTLEVTDEIGCVGTIEKHIDIFDLKGRIKLDNGPNICAGEVINLEAFIESELDVSSTYNWNITNFGNIEEGSPTLEFIEPGNYLIELNYALEDGNCSNTVTEEVHVIPYPEAMMTTNVDSIHPICYPKILEFTNSSQIEGPHTITWIFDDETRILNNEDPTFSFDKGLHTVDLIARSFYGCADTISREFELVSPEGTFEIDILDLCFGDEFTVNLNMDTVDVFSYKWDMGDGTIIENQNPVTHKYSFNPTGNRSSVDLILNAADEACETIVSVPINISEVLADFVIDDNTAPCQGQVTLQNTSLGGSQYQWAIDGQVISTEQNPTITFDPDIDSLDVQLFISDDLSGCESDTTIRLSVNNVLHALDFPNVFSPNRDQINDYFNVTYPAELAEDIEIIEFKVYNRWGNLIYDNDDPENGWDGMHKNEHAPSDVYAYYIEVSVGDCYFESKKGNITIVR